MQKLRSYLYGKLIRPFVESTAPIPGICWGAVIGMFLGMTPTVGGQMYIAGTLWIISRYILRLRFNLPIALAMTWISNPITFIPLYFLYLKTGAWILVWFGYVSQVGSYADFVHAIDLIQQANEYVEWRSRLVNIVGQLFWQFGWPFVVGSLVYAVPLSVLTYPVTAVAMLRYRHRLARNEGLSYEAWKARHVEVL